MKYSDQLAIWLQELGYSHCFFVAGGNIMHLLESCSRVFTCIPVIHEVAAGIAVEYFNEVSSTSRAFALVTAGPGLTNIVTAIAGAYLESRELLVLGGQVKVADLARGQVRQRGIQEIDGVSITRSITVTSRLIDQQLGREEFASLSESGSHGRKGPVFLELPLDIQGAKALEDVGRNPTKPQAQISFEPIAEQTLDRIEALLKAAQRPVLLIGGGVSRMAVAELLEQIGHAGIPIMLTWNGIDRIPEDHPLFLGRPNTWGQRSANLLIQQADLLIALGTRLGLQQTGFNWKQFLPVGTLVQIDCDRAELEKGHPRVDLAVCGDANEVLRRIVRIHALPDYSNWLTFARNVRQAIAPNDPKNLTGSGFISPYEFVLRLSELCTSKDVIIPCSSGSANTVMQQTFQVKSGQRVFNNKSLASMGYGLSGSIGAAFAAQGRRTILVEGDGGFTQNLQELGTVLTNRLHLKMFLFDDNGYASIRMTQRNYFGGRYLGCDEATGLGLPDWTKLFDAYSIPVMRLHAGFEREVEFLESFASDGPAAFLVTIDPEQTYFPKISSFITESGSMESNPLHRMTPDLDDLTYSKVFRYAPES